MSIVRTLAGSGRWCAAGAIASILGVSVPSCGGHSPSSASERGPFPTTVTIPGSTCQAGPGLPSIPASAIFFVTGFSSRVADPSAPPPLEARIRVGDEVEISLQQNGCGIHNRETWTSTDPSVATLTPIPPQLPPGFQVVPAFPEARVTAIRPGKFTVFVEFVASDDKRYRTTLGYCALDARYPGYPGLGGCADPKLIGTVWVTE